MSEREGAHEMTTKTETRYTVETHDYPELTPCANPGTCTEESHWEPVNDEEYDSLADAEWTAEHGTDGPAARINEVRTLIATTAIRTLSFQYDGA